MSHKKTFLGTSTFALAAIFALGIAAFSYSHSPRAEAEQLVNQSIGFVRTVGSDQMSKIQSQLGGDPVQALEEAKAAKDLTILTSDEFKAESAKHKGMAMSSLGKDGPQYGSVGISSNGGLPPAGAEMHSTTGGEIKGPGPVSVKSGAEGTGTSESGTYTKTLETQTGGSGPSNNESGPVKFTPVTPSKYLRYTDSTGHVVVLGLDSKGIPVSKTIFMTDAEVQKLQS